ncbi:glycosyltransferase family 4 protein [Shewanella sp. M16]|uniref:glycosyltransferase family 4 protein n=1 Tax=Shewanella sp. M16 TaxID=2830837 RepID=UPI001BB0379F|nr:glycosyltransferase family 4 protein [Shewanella sp. M16]MBS0043581.1 glycosyltransferase family 4 protein [Shewanella sp. M16]
MKILYLHQYFATPDCNAGTRSYEMAKRLIAKGHEVTFVTTSAFLTEVYNFDHGWNDLVVEGMNLKVLHLPYSNKDSYINRIGKFVSFSIKSSIKSLSIDADVVFATSTPLTIAIPGVLYSKIKKRPMIFEVRDLWPELPIAIGAIKNPLVIKFSKWLEKYAYRNASHLIGLSPGMCDGITRQGIDSSKITLATNSCDTELFHVDIDVGIKYKIQALPFVKSRKLVVYTGTFGVINNVKYIVDVAKSVLDCNYNICFIAIGDGMQKKEVVEYARYLGVLNVNLFILDAVPKNEIVKLLSSADLALSLFGPIKEMWHNSANKLFDALASQTPIAINYGGWQQEFIQKSKCGLVLDQVDFIKSAKMINDFLNDDEKYYSAKSACYDLSYNHYSRDIMASRLEAAIQGVVNV